LAFLLNEFYWQIRPPVRFICVLLAVFCTATVHAKPPQVGELAPDFELSSFSGDRQFKLSNLLGKVVLIDFWASWCAPCKISMPRLSALQSELSGKNFILLAINVDRERAAVERFLRRMPVAHAVLDDSNGAVVELYDVPSMPSSFIIDKKGIVRVIHKGFLPGDEVVLKSQIEELL